jgi:hypothetical protein
VKNLEFIKHNFQSSDFYREAALHYHFNFSKYLPKYFPKYLAYIRQSDDNLKNVLDFKQQQQMLI